jgi:hypothetical protein
MWNFLDLVPILSIYKIRSIAMICGVKTAVLVYDDYYFSGNMDVYHCQPGQMMEIKNMGYMDRITSSMIISSDTYGDMSDLNSVYMQTPVDMALAMDGFHSNIEDKIGDVAETQVYWTNLLTWLVNNTRLDVGISDLTNLNSYENAQVLAFKVDVNVDIIAESYEIIAEWAFQPRILVENPYTNEALNNCLDLSLSPDHNSLWVEDGFFHEEIFEGINKEMYNIGNEIGQAIVDQIYLTGEDYGKSIGELLISNIGSIGWTISDPKSCNPYAVETIDDPCHYYKQIPPMIILNRKTTPGEGGTCCHWWTNGIDCPTPQPSATPRSRPTITPNLLRVENIGGIQSITDVSGLYYYDSLNQKHVFQSVQQLDTWVRERINLDDGEDFLLFRQRIGDKDGLRILIGPTSSISTIRTSLVQQQTMVIPTLTQVSPEIAQDSRINAIKIANKGQNITMDELNMLVTDFNTAVSSKTDIELSNAILDLMSKLSQIKLIVQVPAVTLPVAK